MDRFLYSSHGLGGSRNNKQSIGGTLLSFPGMSTAPSNHKIASGAPKDGHQLLHDYELSSTAKLGNIEIIQPQMYDIEVGSHFTLEF